MAWDVAAFTKRLVETVRTFDQEGTAALCGELIDHLRKTDTPYPEKDAKRVLQHLRNKRFFGHMQNVADAMIQSGQQAPQITRQYAQSLLDQSNLTAAIHVLTALVAETPGNPEENAEARGLLGRAYKQLYVDAHGSSSASRRSHLERAIRSYYDVYVSNPQIYLWHGINTVALICRAERDAIPVSGYPEGKALAKEILDQVESRDLDGKAEMWDFGTAAEACLALDRPDEALSWIRRYVEGPSADAFELASTLRQFTEVWQLESDTEPGMHLLPVIRAALLRKEGSHLDVGPTDFEQGPLAVLADGGQLERVLGKDGFVTVKWYKTGMERCCAVARVELEDGQGVGTGFLVNGKDLHASLDEDLLFLTNAHVISHASQVKGALSPEEAVIMFHARGSENHNPEEYRVKKILWTSPPDQLDATLIRLDKSVQGIIPYPIASGLPVVDDSNQRVYIIGHPSGGTLSFSMHDNILLDHESPFLHYRTPTEGGSSGSPVFNQQWKLIGLHHKGGTRLQKLNGKPGSYAANEGIWIQAIIQELSNVFSKNSSVH